MNPLKNTLIHDQRPLLSRSAATICELYRARWGVEVFFKEIKQSLQLADFMGCNENAVRWQYGLHFWSICCCVLWRGTTNGSIRSADSSP